MNKITETSFQCRRCGECCKHRGDILLMPMDVFQISKYLGIQTEELLDQYTNRKFRRVLWGPAIKAKQDKEQTCIFYQDNKCLIHPVKPAACFLFPFLPVEGGFIINQSGCWHKYYEKEKEKQAIEDLLSQCTKRYKEEKELRQEFLKLVSKVGEAGMDSTSTHLQKIYEVMYTGYDLKADMQQQIRQKLITVEDILIFI